MNHYCEYSFDAIFAKINHLAISYVVLDSYFLLHYNLWFLHIDVYVLLNNIPTSYYLQERRYCPTAPIHLARSTGYSPGRCMDNKFYVRFSLPIFFHLCHTKSVEITIASLVPLDHIALVNVFFIIFLFFLYCFYAIIFVNYCDLWMIYQYFHFKISRLLKAIDRFNDLVVSVYVTAGNILPNMCLIGW